MTRHICLHGAESTGKSTLAPRLAARLGGVVVPEYGRAYAEANGTAFGEVDLLAIFDGHVAATRDAMAPNPEWLMSDPAPLVTQALALLLLGRRLPAHDAWPETATPSHLPPVSLPWPRDARRLLAA